MPNPKHLATLKQGVELWNAWRSANPQIMPDLRRADLSGRRRLFHRANLSRTDLRGANLSRSYFSEAFVYAADFAGADLSHADFNRAYAVEASFERANLRSIFLNEASLDRANLRRADLSSACLYRTSFRGSELQGATLTGADLSGAFFLGSNLKGASLTGCLVHGVSAWDVQLEGAKQSNLIITGPKEPVIQVDSLEIAQFIYLLLNNRRIRDLIDAITSKVVLILGRFTKTRKSVLDRIRSELRRRNYSPVLFDFEQPRTRNITETVSTLAHMARFVIADITDAKSIPQELLAIVPHLPHVPVQPILLAGRPEYGMFEHFRSFPWVLPVLRYQSSAQLLRSFAQVIKPAELLIHLRSNVS
jgi:uncharacterized protein YjbI with pentapeptide repeats